jgi:hypothetical protein
MSNLDSTVWQHVTTLIIIQLELEEDVINVPQHTISLLQFNKHPAINVHHYTILGMLMTFYRLFISKSVYHMFLQLLTMELQIMEL